MQHYDINTIINKHVKTNWKSILTHPLLNNDIENINNMLNQENQTYSPHLKIFPPKNLIFNAFNQFNIENTKVCLVGMDPYHQPNQAMGLCFSVPENIKIPPSLKNIYKSLQKNIQNFNIPNHGNISSWAKEGVLMINSGLTVRESCPGKQLKYWLPYTNFIIKYLSDNYKNIVFILWGNHAKLKRKIINTENNHLILEFTHPSPLSRKDFSLCDHFKKTNQFLQNNHKKPINWHI